MKNRLVKGLFVTAAAVTGGIFVNRQIKLSGDHVVNRHNSAYLHFAETQRRQGRKIFKPWRTSDENLLNIIKEEFPGLSIPDSTQLRKPHFPAVEILPLKAAAPSIREAYKKQQLVHIVVGGPPAAMVAVQKAVDGKPVLYVNCTSWGGKEIRPIWAGSALHGEFDVLTEAPAFTAGLVPSTFVSQELKTLVNPPRFDQEVLAPDFRWQSLDWWGWVKHPEQWLEGLRAAWSNQLHAWQHTDTMALGRPTIVDEVKPGIHQSGKWLEAFDQYTGRKIFRFSRGSLITAPTNKAWENLQGTVTSLANENRQLHSLSTQEAVAKYGFIPRNVVGQMEKTHDAIFRSTFLATVVDTIQTHGGEVNNQWYLRRIFVNTDTPHQGGVMEFAELAPSGEELLHYRAFEKAHLSLGATRFVPHNYDLISVTGVSVNALVFGVGLTGPIVCGGSNHAVPLADPVLIDIKDPVTGEMRKEIVTPVRLTAAGCVGPRDRGDDWNTYDGHHAVHLLHRFAETLPENARVEVLSVMGCNRVIGADGILTWISPTVEVDGKVLSVSNIRVQVGPGGGGLTQSGIEAARVAKNPHNFFHTKSNKTSREEPIIETPVTHRGLSAGNS